MIGDFNWLGINMNDDFMAIFVMILMAVFLGMAVWCFK